MTLINEYWLIDGMLYVGHPLKLTYMCESFVDEAMVIPSTHTVYCISIILCTKVSIKLFEHKWVVYANCSPDPHILTRRLPLIVFFFYFLLETPHQTGPVWLICELIWCKCAHFTSVVQAAFLSTFLHAYPTRFTTTRFPNSHKRLRWHLNRSIHWQDVERNRTVKP